MLFHFLQTKRVFIFFRQIYSTRTFVLPVIILTMTYNIPKFFELTVSYIPVDYITQQVRITFKIMQRQGRGWAWLV